MAVTKSQIKKAQELIIKVFNKLDKTGINTEHYKKLFSKMSDKEFIKFASCDFPYRFHERPFETNTDMEDVKQACDIMGVPLMERVKLPYLYEDENGNSVNTLECYTVYTHFKKVQQFITHKNSMSSDVTKRDMKTGLLNGFDKNGKTSDREMESLAILDLDDTLTEFARPKADSMKAKNYMENIINTTGQVSQKDIPIDKDDSLSKNLFNTYMIGALLNSNIVNNNYTLPYTLKDKKKEILRK